MTVDEVFPFNYTFEHLAENTGTIVDRNVFLYRRIQWCKENIGSYYTLYTRRNQPELGRAVPERCWTMYKYTFYFKTRDDLLLFKLAMGGLNDGE